MKKLLLLIMLTATIAAAQNVNHCKGTTNKDEPCKITAVDKEGYCRFHSPNAIRCGAIKKDGKPCRQLVAKAGEHCHFHK